MRVMMWDNCYFIFILLLCYQVGRAFSYEFQWQSSLFGLISRIAKHKNDLDKLMTDTNILGLEPRMDKYLCLVLMTELLFGSGSLIGESKPVECIRKYEPQFRQLLTGNPWMIEAPAEGETVKRLPVKGTNCVCFCSLHLSRRLTKAKLDH